MNVPTGTTGSNGTDGANGVTPTITAGTTTTIDYPGVASVTKSDASTETDVIFDFVIPRGQEGPAGRDGEDGQNGAPGANGVTPDITAGTTTTIEYPGVADVTKNAASTETDVIFDFVIPRGQEGPAGRDAENPTFSIGTVTTVDSTEDADVTITQDPPNNYILDFDIPQGATGSNGVNFTFDSSSTSTQDFYDLHPTGVPGETWLVEGHLFTWDAETSSWKDMGSLIGPQGPQGPQGDQGESGSVPSELLNGAITASTPLEYTVGGVTFSVVYATGTDYCRLSMRPADPSKPILLDMKRSSTYDSAVDGADQKDNYTLTGTLLIDSVVFYRSREMHKTWLRQQDPDTERWRLDEINLFISNGSQRATVWVNEIFKNVEL